MMMKNNKIKKWLKQITKGINKMSISRKPLKLLLNSAVALGLMLGVALSVKVPVALGASLDTQLGMLVDGSGSINDSEWSVMINGLAEAIEDISFPKNGTVELTIVQFGGTSSRLEVGPVVITSANADNVVGQIQSIPKLGGNTPLACGFYGLADVMKGSGDNYGNRQKSPTKNSGYLGNPEFNNPTGVYSNGGGYAEANDGDVHQYYGYGFSIPSNATIDGVDVRLQAWRQSGHSRSGSLRAWLSWDGGSSWTPAGTPAYSSTGNLTSHEKTYILGGSSNTWGHAWTTSQINNSDNFRVKIEATASNSWIHLDWVSVTVYYHYHYNAQFSSSLRQYINVVTDGVPNVCCTSSTGGSYCGKSSGKISAVTARDAIITDLGMTPARDRISAEGIDITSDNIEWLRSSIVWPPEGQVVDDPPFPGNVGWVRVCGTFQEFAATIQEKFEFIFPSLTLTKTTSTPTVVNTSSGTQATYQVVVTNNGTATATGVQITDSYHNTK